MKKVLVNLFLCLLFFNNQQAYAQFSELSMLEGLSESIGKRSSDQPLLPNDENKDEDTSDVPKEDNVVDLTNEDFNYSGSDNFRNRPEYKKDSRTKLEYFGYKFFTDNETTFAPNNNIPVQPNYLIGPGDNLKIILYGNTNDQFTVEVSRDGDIYFPDIGPISVAGLTFKDARETIEGVVSNRIIGTEVNITLGALRSIQIFVLGDTFQPGAYSVSALSSLTNAIFSSGGIRPSGSLRNIQLKRDGKLISEFDLYKLLLEGDSSGDKRLLPGDVIFIPPVGKTVAVDGQVTRPGIYELNDNESLRDLLKFSGSIKPKGNLKKAELQRIDYDNENFSLQNVDISSGKNNQIPLKNGDLIMIHPIYNEISSAILLSGHAKQPGFYPWQPGMMISDILGSTSDLLSYSDLGYVLVVREDKINQNKNFHQVDLREIFQRNDQNVDFELFERDEIIILPSLLTPSDITTRLIRDKYIIDEDEQFTLEDEWNDLTYLRKSLKEEKLLPSLEEKTQVINPITGEAKDDTDIRRYYEYSINNYCVIPEDLALKIVESSGYESKKSIELEQLAEITDPLDMQRLIAEAEAEKDAIEEGVGDDDLSISNEITDLCRRQLLDPIVDLANRQINDATEKQIISVFGNVHFPGDFPLTVNMNLTEAIKASGGLKEASYDTEIELSRRDLSGKKYTVSNIFASANSITQMSEELKPKDIVNIKQISSDIKTVEITGEVYFPGIYPIAENQTLTDLIKRAGGVTEFGSTQAAYFQRQSLKEAEASRLNSAKQELRRKILLSSQSGGLGQNSLDSNAIVQLTALLAEDSPKEDVLGRLVIDLEAMLTEAEEDIVLEDGDMVNIPKFRQTISVLGEVYVSNSHIFKDNYSLDDYINLSGGATQFADTDSTYLIKSDGSIISPSRLSSSGFFRRGTNIIEPGDTIVVPLMVTPFSGIKATTEVTQIIYQMALAAAAVNSF